MLFKKRKGGGEKGSMSLISHDSWRLINRGDEAMEHEEGRTIVRVEAPEGPPVGIKKTIEVG